MDFDFLVFPSPKCSYNKTKLGNELIFIPKYAKSTFSDCKKHVNQISLPTFFSKQILSPPSSYGSMAKITKLNKKSDTLDSSNSTLNSNFQSPRKINVKLEMNNYLTKKRNDDKPVTPLIISEVCEDKGKKRSEHLKKHLNLQEMEFNEQEKSFFLKNKNDFDEGIDANCLSSPKKILDYKFKDPQNNKTFQMSSPRTSTAKYKSRTHYYGNASLSFQKMNLSFKKDEIEKIDHFIPCLLLEPETPTDKILVYFHGNAEDIYLAYELLYYIERYLRVRILAVEYPGYGVYTSHKPNSDLIQEDSIAVYDYLVKKVGFKEKNIMVLGRSIGSGPASYLASQRNPGALIMMSSFTSLRSVVKDHVGGLQKILKERFNNHENIKKVKCPCFFIHGLQDKLISYQHSQKLHDACGGPSELCLPKEMTHSEFCFDSDFIIPLEAFLRNYGFDFFEEEYEAKRIKFPPEVYKMNRNLKY